MLKAKKEDIEKLEEWEKNRKAQFLTDKKAKALYNNGIKTSKALLIKSKPKEKKNN